jgi:hypothetical protein
MLPRSPITNAPAADTMSVRPGSKILVALFAAYAAQENTTMTGNWMLRQDCRLEREEQMEYSGTRTNTAYQGKGCRHHDQESSLRQPLESNMR